jgi:hypothetical protein
MSEDSAYYIVAYFPISAAGLSNELALIAVDDWEGGLQRRISELSGGDHRPSSWPRLS